MERDYYLELASRRIRMPIGTDLVLHEEADPQTTMQDGLMLGKVVERAARRYNSPLAIPLMDLRLEKSDLLRTLGISETECDTFHFGEAPGEELLAKMQDGKGFLPSRRTQAHIGSISYIASKTELLPVGMAIGPFSLMTKLMKDPIAPVALAGLGITGGEDRDVLMAEQCLALAEMAVSKSIAAQIGAGAKAITICEPAANSVYLSPKQIAAGADIFERFVMQPNLRLRDQMAAASVDLIFHDCGNLTSFMVKEFAERLHPVILSLGSSRKLWEDAASVPLDVVLFGNLPTKSFYSDSVMPLEKVESMTRELLQRMQEIGHPHILGSECDVLYVPEASEAITRKVGLMLTCDETVPALH